MSELEKLEVLLRDHKDEWHMSSAEALLALERRLLGAFGW